MPRILTTADRRHAYWECRVCGKRSPLMLVRHAVQAGVWHDFVHDPMWRWL
jgi:hypothetical protein